MLKKNYSQNDRNSPLYPGGNKGKYSLGLNLAVYGMFCCHFLQNLLFVKQTPESFVTYFYKKPDMYKFISLAVFLCSSLLASAQKTDLALFEKKRINMQKNAMIVLGGWSAANIIVSGIATDTRNKEARYFHQMNVMWGGINLAIAGLGYWGANREKIDNPTLAAVLKHQNKTEKTFLLNAGLDVVYIGGGLLMNQTSDNQKVPERFKGYGNSIMLQGGFLLIFDAINYAIHRKHGKQLNGMVEKITLNGGPGSIYLTYRF